MPVTVDHTEKEGRVEVDKEEWDSLMATVETLQDQEVLEQLAQSQKDKDEGNVSRWKEVKERIL